MTSSRLAQIWDGFSKEAKAQMLDGVAQGIPVKHVALPDEIAEAFLFVMKYVFAHIPKCTSNTLFRCNYVTGQRIEVDGGYSLV